LAVILSSCDGSFLYRIEKQIFYSVIPDKAGMVTSPDWLLGFLFGTGGFVGIYLGARFQKFVPQKAIKLMLGTIIVFLAIRYISQYVME
jgi:hypothetical protein